MSVGERDGSVGGVRTGSVGSVGDAWSERTVRQKAVDGLRVTVVVCFRVVGTETRMSDILAFSVSLYTENDGNELCRCFVNGRIIICSVDFYTNKTALPHVRKC